MSWDTFTHMVQPLRGFELFAGHRKCQLSVETVVFHLHNSLLRLVSLTSPEEGYIKHINKSIKLIAFEQWKSIQVTLFTLCFMQIYMRCNKSF